MSWLVSLGLVLSAPAAVAQEDYLAERLLGIEAFYADQFDEAIERWERCLELRPDAPEGERRLAEAHARNGSIDAALAALGRYVELGGDERYRIATDPALERLRAEPRYSDLRSALLANFEERVRGLRERALAQRQALQESRGLIESSRIIWRDGGSSAVNFVENSPDEERIVTVGRGDVLMWDSWSGEQLASLGKHSAYGVVVEYSPAGETVLITDAEALQVSLWDGRGGEALGLLQEGEELVLGACYLSEGHVVTADERGILRTWSTLSGELVQRAEAGIPIQALEVRPDGSLLTRDEDARCRVRDPSTGDVLRVLDSRVPVLSSGALPDGRLLTVGEDGTTRLWPEVTGAPLVFPGRPGDYWGSELAKSMSPDGSRLHTLDGSGMRLWDARSATPIAALVLHASDAQLATWTVDGNLLTAVGEIGLDVMEWRGDSGERVGGLRSATRVHYLDSMTDGRLVLANEHGAYVLSEGRAFVPLQSHVPRVLGFALGRDGRVFSGLMGTRPIRQDSTVRWSPQAPLVARDTARFWSLESGLSTGSIDLSGIACHEALFANDGRVLVVTPRGCTLVDADLQVLRDINVGALGAVLSPDEERVASYYASGEGRYAKLWSTEGDLLGSFPELAEVGGTWVVPMPAFSPGEDGLLVTAHADHSIRVWDGFNGEPVHQLNGHTQEVRHMAFSPDGASLLTCGRDGVARLWAMWPHFEARHALSTGDGLLWHGAYGPDGERVAAGGASGTVRLWDARSGELLHEFAGHAGYVWWIGFHPDGDLLLTCGADGTARLWNVKEGSPGPVLRGHQAAIWEAAFTEDGSRALTRGRDGTTRVWEIPSGRLLLTHVEYADRGWLSFEPGGHYVAGGSAADRARVRVKGELYPLSSYASVLESEEKVAASLAGEVVSQPTLLAAPELSISSLPNGTVHDRRVQVEGRIQSRHGIAEVVVTRGGRLQDGVEVPPVALEAALVQSGLQEVGGDRDLRLDLSVPIPPGWSEVIVRVRARSDRDIWSQVETVHRRYVPPTGRLFVLAIGVQDYDDDRFDLTFSRKDAKDVVALFEQQTALFGEIRTRILLDSEVTYAALNEALEEFLYPASEEDTIVVFVAGHGARSRVGTYYFLTPDATPEKPTGGIPRSEIYKLVQWEGIRAKKRLLLIDTCNAGEDFGEGKRGVGLGEAFNQDEVNAAFREGNGLYIVAASTELGAARESDGNGVFTRALLDGLGGKADSVYDKGTVDVRELVRYVEEEVMRVTDGAQRPTVPRAGGGRPFPVSRVP